jgi:hypothetical protein
MSDTARPRGGKTLKKLGVGALVVVLGACSAEDPRTPEDTEWLQHVRNERLEPQAPLFSTRRVPVALRSR